MYPDTNIKTRTSHSLEETEKIAQDFLSELNNFSNDSQARVIGLSGDLGSGKTTFTQAVAKLLGITETVTSPTFIIEKIYKLTGQKNFEHLIHIDAYRLEKAEELEKLGWQELISNSRNLILIEWPEKVASILPSDMLHIHFIFIDEKTREISF